MSMEEVNEILKLLAEIDLEKLNFDEQLYYMKTVYEFSKNMKPIVMKYAMQERTKHTFLMKFGDDCNEDEY